MVVMWLITSPIEESGDVKVEMGLLDVPLALYTNALGYGDDDGIYYFGADTVAKNVSILIESNTADGEPVYYGFYKGQLSMDAIDFETLKDKANELATTSVNFTATASSDVATKGRYGAIVYGSDAEKLKKLKGQLNITAAG
ncbi:major tail protein [Streptococcus pneumoniae]|nr:major tail protein [Streptococcus pneumoniae]